jgi:hypothetical protein
MGPASLYLGVWITHDFAQCKLWLSQKSYYIELLWVWNMMNCMTASTSIVYLLTSLPNFLSEVANDDIKPLFQKLVSSLIYLAICTHPDIAYFAMALGQFNANPSCAHLMAAKCVLQYLAGTLDLALEFNFDGSVVPVTLRGFIHACAVSDADWASDKLDCQSISGYCFHFLNSLVSWSSVKQESICLSSTKAEYYSMTHALKDTPGWQGFMSDYCRTGITPCLSNKEYVFYCMHAQADCWRRLRDASGWQGFMSDYWRIGATPHWVLAILLHIQVKYQTWV